jgi:2-polyprenyl-6-methoxyphenol hydroxylase-like FAD-dependent oxidoreductase
VGRPKTGNMADCVSDLLADVIVVGGGPSGLTVASELALAGVKVIVLERRTELVRSRAGTILPRVLELLDARGLAENFITRARKIVPNPLFTTHMWAGMQPVHWSHLNSRFGFRLVMPQNITEDLLLTHARAVGVDVRHGWQMISLEQDDDGVRVQVETPDGVETLQAQWLVGADGGRSPVRNAVGIELDGRETSFTGIVADVKFDFPWPGGRRIVDNEHGWLASFPFSEVEPLTRFNMVHAERRRARQDEPVTADEVRSCLRDILGEDVPFDELRWGSRFGDAMWHARRYREGRVVLVGEASRIHYPASGVGMNFCIQDGFNLGWKLAAVVKGHSPAALIDSYEEERRPVTDALLQSVLSQCAIQFNFSREGMAVKRMFKERMLPIAEVNSRVAHELNGLSFPYPRATDSDPAIGHRVPDVDIVTESGSHRIGELLRQQQFLLIDLTGSDTFGQLSFGDLPVRTVSGVPVLVPPLLRGLTAMLVRPDAYIGWASREAVVAEDAQVAIRPWYPAANVASKQRIEGTQTK